MMPGIAAGLVIVAMLMATIIRASLGPGDRTVIRELASASGDSIPDPNAAVSPDATRVAYLDYAAQRLMLLDLDSEEAGLLADLNRAWRGHTLQWSPDGRYLAFADRPTPGGATVLELFDLQEQSRRTLFTLNDAALLVLGWGPSGDRILAAANDLPPPQRGRLLVIDLGGRERASLAADFGGPDSFDLSPDGRWVAYSAAGEDSLDIYIARLGDLMLPVGDERPDAISIAGSQRVTTDPQDDVTPVWSPNGSRLLWISWRGGGSDIWGIDFAAGAAVGVPMLVRRGLGDANYLRDWLPNDRLVLLSHTAVRDLYTVPVDPESGRATGEPRIVSAARSSVRSFSWAPGSDRIVFKSRHQEQLGDVYITDARPETRLAAPERLHLDRPVFQPTWDPLEDRFLYVGPAPEGDGRTIWAYSLTTGEHSRLSEDICFLGGSNLAFEASGQRLLFNVYQQDSGPPGLYLYERQTGQLRLVAGSEPVQASLSADGQWIAYTTEQKRWVSIMRRDGSDDRMIADPPDRWRIQPDFSFSPDAKWVAYPVSASNGNCWDYRLQIAARDGSTQHELELADEFEPFRARWSPDGRQIAFVSLVCDAGIWILEGQIGIGPG